MSSQVILITAATGTQSSNVIHALSDYSSTTSTKITLHALTRDPSSPSAQSLLSYVHPQCNIKLFKADFDDAEALKAAAIGCTSAFLNVFPAFTDLTAEKRHADNVISALVTVASTTIRRIVYSSAHIPSKDNLVNIKPGSWMESYLQSKHSIEDAVIQVAREKGWEWTILHPAYFLTNFLPPASDFMYSELKTSRKVVTALTPEHKLNVVNLEDFGRFAAASLTWTGEKYANTFQSKIVPFANARLTLRQIVDGLNDQLRRDPKAQGVQVELVYMSDDEVAKLKDNNILVESQVFLMDNPSEVDTEKIRGYGIPLAGVESFWEKEKDRVRSAVGLE